MLFLLAISGASALLLGGGLVILLLLLTYAIGRHLRSAKPKTETMANRTKYAKADVFRYRPLFFRLGLVCALGWAVLAMSWTIDQPSTLPVFMNFGCDLDLAIQNESPITRLETPSPPPPPPPIFWSVDLEDELEEPDTTRTPLVNKVLADSIELESAGDNLEPPPPPPLPPPPPPPPELFCGFSVVEDMPVFGDCVDIRDKATRKRCSDQALLDYVAQHYKYPPLARDQQIEGTAVVSFVVEKDGSMTDLQLRRDPGAGLGTEALRVVEELAAGERRWVPGKQRGRPVPVSFNLPVRFRLEKE